MELLQYQDIWSALLSIAGRYGKARADQALADLIHFAAWDDRGAWLPRTMVIYK